MEVVWNLHSHITAGSFWVSLVTEWGGPKIWKMPCQFYDKLAYFMLYSLVRICSHKMSSWGHNIFLKYGNEPALCNVYRPSLMSFLLFQLDAAVRTDHLQSQWVDLCVLTEACIPVPDTCGPEGAAVAFWVKLTEDGGIISSYGGQSGFLLRCDSGQIMLEIIWVHFYFESFKWNSLKHISSFEN